MSNKNTTKRALVFLPANARLNWGNDLMNPPPVKYEKRKTAIGKDVFRKIVRKSTDE